MIDCKLPYNGTSYTALRFAAMRKNKPFSTENLMKTMGHKFKKPYDTNRSLMRLTKHGLLNNTDGQWVITKSGLEYLRKTAKIYYGDSHER